MSISVEGIGDVATGGLLAAVVEPDGGYSEHPPGICQNCSNAVASPFCSRCGQKAVVHRTLAAFWHDLIHGVFNFDGKIWRTLPLLVWHPGQLTRRYVHGERAKFVSPLALFLFSVFLTYASVHSLFPKSFGGNFDVPGAAIDNLNAEANETRIAIRELETGLSEAKAGGLDASDVKDIETEIAEQKSELIKIEQKRAATVKALQRTQSGITTDRKKTEAKIAALEARIAAAEKLGKSTADLEVELKGEELSLKIYKNAAKFVTKGGTVDYEDMNTAFFGIESLNKAAKEALSNPQLMMYKVQSSAYKYAWLLILMSTPFVWLTFAWRRQYMMFDHAVFVTYSLCFMLLLVTAGTLWIQSGVWTSFAIIILTFLPAIHIYRQLKEAYLLSRFSTLWRTAVLCTFAVIVLTIFLAIIITLGATG